MGKLDIIYRATNDLAHLNSGNLNQKDKQKFKKYFYRIFFKTYFLKFMQTNHEKFREFEINFFNYKDFFFLYKDIFTRHCYYFESGNESPLILDCGANIGLATIYFKWLFPKAEIHSFEPDNNTFKKLEENVKLNNLSDVYLYNAALSDKNGKISFFVDNDRPGSLVMSTIYDRMPKNKIEVDSVSLSDFMVNKLNGRTIDLLKMDIEGAEHTVLNDIIEKKLMANFNEMILEYHHNIGEENSKLGKLLNQFEENNFNYQIEAEQPNLYQKNNFQDLMIYFYKR